MQALILPFAGFEPQFGKSVFVAPGASVIGNVTCGTRVSIWYSAVVRGDVNSITIGADSNVQDGAVLHGTLDEWPVVIGERVSIGHRATVHGCVLEDDVLIGIGAVVLDGAHIGRGSLIGAGALVREGARIPPNSLVVGLPGRVRRDLSEREVEVLRRTPGRYRELARSTREACIAAGHADPFQS